MIPMLAELFVQHAAPAQPVAVRAARSVLAVDAGDAGSRLHRLLITVEQAVPVHMTLVKATELEAVPRHRSYDNVWLFTGSACDPFYAELLAAELCARFKANVVALADSEPQGIDASNCEWVELAGALGDRVAPWRARRRRAGAVRRLLELLEWPEAKHGG